FQRPHTLPESLTALCLANEFAAWVLANSMVLPSLRDDLNRKWPNRQCRSFLARLPATCCELLVAAATTLRAARSRPLAPLESSGSARLTAALRRMNS